MKKLFILGICLFIFMIAPNVEAMEYSISYIYNNGDYIDLNVEPGDIITYDIDRDIVRFIIIDLIEIENENSESMIGGVYDIPNHGFSYTILSYEEATGKEIPDGKKATIQLRMGSYCGHSQFITLEYSLVNENPKKVIYNNTYGALNSNPTSYYEEETDILLSDISRDGYEFLGWYTSPTFEEDTRVTMITSDEPDVLNLYAKWEKIDAINEDTFTNPNTNSMFYIAIGIGFILILGTALVIVYKYKKL